MKASEVTINIHYDMLKRYARKNGILIELNEDIAFDCSHFSICHYDSSLQVTLGLRKMPSISHLISILCHELGHCFDYRKVPYNYEELLRFDPDNKIVRQTTEANAWVRGLDVLKSCFGRNSKIVRAYIDCAIIHFPSYRVYGIQEVLKRRVKARIKKD